MSSQKDIEIEDVAIRGRLDIEDIVRLQINRCNASAYEPDQTLFESSVKVLLDLLPYYQRIKVLEGELEYTEEKDVVFYDKVWCGRPLTSSKRVEKRAFVDFHKLYRVVLDAYAEKGLTWQIEPRLVEKGKVEKEKSIPTPHLLEEKTDGKTETNS